MRATKNKFKHIWAAVTGYHLCVCVCCRKPLTQSIAFPPWCHDNRSHSNSNKAAFTRCKNAAFDHLLALCRGDGGGGQMQPGWNFSQIATSRTFLLAWTLWYSMPSDSCLEYLSLGYVSSSTIQTGLKRRLLSCMMPIITYFNDPFYIILFSAN